MHALSKVLASWSKKKNLITIALIDELNFYFLGIHPNFELPKLVKFFLGKDIENELIQIALPKLYRHRPLYSVPLYHELGHFIDNDNRIVQHSLILKPPSPALVDQERNHRKEFFADLFATMYTGQAQILFMDKLCPSAPACFSHPSTKDRIKTMELFLSGKSNEIIDIFQDILTKHSLPTLETNYVVPNIVDCFDNIRTYCIQSDAELHGILEAGLLFLENLSGTPRSPWKDLSNEFEPDRIVNDLIEKSIRNKIIVDKWNNGTA